ncbi:uncharacterized protein PSFLO_03047 [Pseudozyma flocculosa]|uniref:GRAM domain-containing protein n=1 Tax=Pseudozyma flocculosa TaxID=84751 RepID=A0A5C3EZQ9_9BASI|nr:uncharacterized protein PSFLO_03047 [Pseudozyma flocculosa]
MALNWVTLDEMSSRPLPLDDERFLHSVQNAALTLDFSGSAKASYKATGRAFVTSRRVVFLIHPMPPPPPPGAPPPTSLHSLSVPHDHFQNFRYIIPIFSAAYLEAEVFPVTGGGLPQRQTGEPETPKGKLKIWFNEGGGVAFRDAVERAKKEWEEVKAKQADEDALPMLNS